MVADALVYHPTVSHYLRFVATTVGRDKVLRLIQYFSRFYAWYLFRTNHPESSVKTFETTKKVLGQARKLLRLGKFVEHFKAAAVASDKKDIDPVIKFLTVSRQLGYAGYLSFDNMAILDVTGIKKFDGAKSLTQTGARFWLMGLISSLANSLYKLNGLRIRRAQIDSKEGEGAVEKKKIEKEWNATRLQLISDSCDVLLPSNSLGYITLDDGIVGLAGMTSSLIGLYSAWEKVRQ